jgi:hypothetical protein
MQWQGMVSFRAFGIAKAWPFVGNRVSAVPGHNEQSKGLGSLSGVSYDMQRHGLAL